jgi:hypothetical protein
MQHCHHRKDPAAAAGPAVPRCSAAFEDIAGVQPLHDAAANKSYEAIVSCSSSSSSTRRSALQLLTYAVYLCLEPGVHTV